MLGEALRSISRPRHPFPSWLVEAREILHARFNESLSLAEIAGAVKVHPVYLATEFHRRYRWTVGDYVRQLRIQRAVQELRSLNSPLAEVALNAGFSSQSHFCRVFKRFVGVTPGQYRVSSGRF
jgi:AraC family transcriptional regulator